MGLEDGSRSIGITGETTPSSTDTRNKNGAIPCAPPPPPPQKNWAKFYSRPSADQKFSLAPLAPIHLDQKIFLTPLASKKTQEHWGGGGGGTRKPIFFLHFVLTAPCAKPETLHPLLPQSFDRTCVVRNKRNLQINHIPCSIFQLHISSTHGMASGRGTPPTAQPAITYL